jgi:hypothetical protein
MGFNAGSVVKPMDWDFSDFDGPKGTVPEPTDKQIATFYKELRDLSEKVARHRAGLTAESTPEDIAEAMAKLTPGDVFEEMLAGTRKVYAKACTNQPSEAVLKKLPARIQIAFFQWFQRELRPEVSGVDLPTRPNLRMVNGA